MLFPVSVPLWRACFIPSLTTPAPFLYSYPLFSHLHSAIYCGYPRKTLLAHKAQVSLAHITKHGERTRSPTKPRCPWCMSQIPGRSQTCPQSPGVPGARHETWGRLTRWHKVQVSLAHLHKVWGAATLDHEAQVSLVHVHKVREAATLALEAQVSLAHVTKPGKT